MADNDSTAVQKIDATATQGLRQERAVGTPAPAAILANDSGNGLLDVLNKFKELIALAVAIVGAITYFVSDATFKEAQLQMNCNLISQVAKINADMVEATQILRNEAIGRQLNEIYALEAKGQLSPSQKRAKNTLEDATATSLKEIKEAKRRADQAMSANSSGRCEALIKTPN